MGFGLSAAYFATVCVIAIGSVVLSISIAKPEKLRTKGLCIFGISLLYVLVSLFLWNTWGDMITKFYGHWAGFTVGIIFGIPVLIITAGTAIGILGLSLYMMVSGRLPACLQSMPAHPLSSRLGLVVLLVLIVLGVFALGMFVK